MTVGLCYGKVPRWATSLHVLHCSVRRDAAPHVARRGGGLVAAFVAITPLFLAPGSRGPRATSPPF
ncbi:hypothetical protein AKJ09_04764 [Labilithrix luteola]|uniref:Uncharacterized protein n=1 Tax=Labilithrix luteola TaxID=1391654 RepID=A0A0K1PX43_9BACT|nr:hypothetical protein AKJ09_04764 [Labilithrix luteola]